MESIQDSIDQGPSQRTRPHLPPGVLKRDIRFVTPPTKPDASKSYEAQRVFTLGRSRHSPGYLFDDMEIIALQRAIKAARAIFSSQRSLRIMSYAFKLEVDEEEYIKIPRPAIDRTPVAEMSINRDVEGLIKEWMRSDSMRVVCIYNLLRDRRVYGYINHTYPNFIHVDYSMRLVRASGKALSTNSLGLANHHIGHLAFVIAHELQHCLRDSLAVSTKITPPSLRDGLDKGRPYRPSAATLAKVQARSISKNSFAVLSTYEPDSETVQGWTGEGSHWWAWTFFGGSIWPLWAGEDARMFEDQIEGLISKRKDESTRETMYFRLSPERVARLAEASTDWTVDLPYSFSLEDMVERWEVKRYSTLMDDDAPSYFSEGLGANEYDQMVKDATLEGCCVVDED